MLNIRPSEDTSGVIMGPPASDVTLTFQSSDNADIVYNSTTKELIATKPLGRDLAMPILVTFLCKSNVSSPSSSPTLSVIINIAKINKLGPVWEFGSKTVNESTVSIEENKDGTLIDTTQGYACSGRDDSLVDILAVSIVKSGFSDYFQAGTGNLLILKVIKPFDYEKTKSVLITIRCEDKNSAGTLIGTADLALNVTVTNVPEKGSYTFNHTDYSAILSLDDVKPGKVLNLSPAPLSATNSLADQPVEPNFVIESILVNNLRDDELLSINSKTGVITIAKNFSEPVSFIVRVKVSVLGDTSPTNIPNTATINGKFKPPSGLRLQFEAASIGPISVLESTPNNSQLRTVRVRYASPQNVQFEVETHKDTFYFAGSSLKLLRNLDFEKNDKAFVVRIKASDNTTANNTGPITADLNIAVVDVNDNSPKFVKEKYDFGVSFSDPKNSLIGKVQANDSDTNSVLTFIITGDTSQAFRINQTTGEIFLTIDGRKLNNTAYSFVVRASDGKNDNSVLVEIKVSGNGGKGSSDVSRADSTVLVAILGVTVFLILLVALVGFCWFKRRRTSYNAEARRKKQMDSHPPGDSLYYSETGMTTLQDNPVYGDFDDGGIDMGIFKGDRDVSEIELYDSGDIVAPSLHGGTIQTGVSNTLSSFQHAPPYMQNGHSIRLSNNMELVSADNAVYSEQVDQVSAERKDELTIYY